MRAALSDTHSSRPVAFMWHVHVACGIFARPSNVLSALKFRRRRYFGSGGGLLAVGRRLLFVCCCLFVVRCLFMCCRCCCLRMRVAACCCVLVCVCLRGYLRSGRENHSSVGPLSQSERVSPSRWTNVRMSPSTAIRTLLRRCETTVTLICAYASFSAATC